MKTITLLMLPLLLITGQPLYDFNSKETSGNWRIVNDDVMGGVSRSTMVLNEEGTARFSGKLSPDNNGGFASVRASLEQEPQAGLTGVKIRLRGDGKVYNIRFRTNSNFDGYAYQARVSTVANEWKEFEIPFADFEATFRGYTLKGKPALESQHIKQVGILIADKQFGDFWVEVDWIRFY